MKRFLALACVAAVLAVAGVAVAKKTLKPLNVHDINATGDVAVTGDLTVTGTVTAGSTAYEGSNFDTDLTVSTNLFKVEADDGSLSLGAGLNDFTVSATGDVYNAGTLQCVGASTFSGLLTANGGIYSDLGAFAVADSTGNVSTTGTLAVTGASTLTGAVTAGSTLAVTGASTLTGNVACGGTLAVTGTTALTGNATAAGTLAVTGNTTVGGTLGVTGATTVAAITASGTAALNNGITVDSTAFTVANTSGNVATTGTLAVTGATTLTGLLTANGGIAGGSSADIAINTNKFQVTASSGNTAVAGTLAVTGTSALTGATTVTGALNANGGMAFDTNALTIADTTGAIVGGAGADITLNTDKFTVDATQGNTTVGGTLGVTGLLTATAGIAGGAASDITLNTNMFTVDATQGNTLVAGTLGVTGLITATAGLSGGAASDITLNTNMFTVDATQGNTAIAGTLAVTGATTQTGALACSSSLTVDGTTALTGATTASAITMSGILRGNLQPIVSAASGSTQLLASQSGARVLNTGTSSTTTFTLPTAAAGLHFCFIEAGDAAGELLITPTAGDSIKAKVTVDGAQLVPAAGTGVKNTAATNTISDSMCLIATDADTWRMESISGTWASQ